MIFVHSHPSVYYKIAYVYIKGFSTSLICFKNGIATTTYIVYNSKTNKLEEKGVYDRTPSLFVNSPFNGDISNWNVNNVTNMMGIFSYSKFNGNISKWNVSNVTNMSDMFLNSKFTGNINKWKLNSKCTIYGNEYNRSFKNLLLYNKLN